MCGLFSNRAYQCVGGRDLGLGVAANEDRLASGCKRTHVSSLRNDLSLPPPIMISHRSVLHVRSWTSSFTLDPG